MSYKQPEGSVHISEITLSVQQESGKTLDYVTLQSQTEHFKKGFSVNIPPGKTHTEVFNPVFKLSIGDQLLISMQYQSPRLRWSRPLQISVDLSKAKAEARDDSNGRKTYVTSHKNIEIAIGIHSIPSQVSGDPPSTSTGEITNSSGNGQIASKSASLDASGDASLPSTTGESTNASSANTSISPTAGETADAFSGNAPLPPTTGEILKICPRFRLLIIGNTGVGKSTLIKKVFGVEEVDVSESSRGKAEITREFVAKENELFVLHDSVGLEAGESANMKKINDFIHERRKEEDIKNRLHAVWVCLAVPFAKGRLLETGMENFLKNKNDILGDIPIVVVLTKLDLLDRLLLFDLSNTGAVESLEDAKKVIEPHRTKFLQDYCIEPLKKVAGDVPQVSVSTEGGFGLEPTIAKLIRTTTEQIELYVRNNALHGAQVRTSLERDAPLYVAGMAQRGSIEEKINHTIELGKKEYWKNLRLCFKFSSEEVKRRMLVVHEDIIQGWNFNDPKMILQGDDFKTALLNTSNLGLRDSQGFRTESEPVMTDSLAATILSMYGKVIILPIAGPAAVVQLFVEIVKSPQVIAKRFMAYIVGLVYVMKILFILVPQRSITTEDMGFALKAYEKWHRNRIHLEIRDFSIDAGLVPGRDLVMEKIETLIRRYEIKDKEVAELRGKIQAASAKSKSKAKAS